MIAEIRALLLPWYMANVPQYEPPHEQNPYSCTISAIVECEYITKGPEFNRLDYEPLWEEFSSTVNMPYAHKALEWAEDTGRIGDWGHISRRDARKHLSNGGQLILGINDYYKDNWILRKSRSSTAGHAVCAVGYLDVGDGYYIVRNTWGEDMGLNGYYVVEEDVVTRLYTFNVKY